MKSPKIKPQNYKSDIHPWLPEPWHKSGETQIRQLQLLSDGPQCMVGGALALVLNASRCAGAAAFKVTGADADWRLSISPIRVICQHIGMTALNIMAITSVILDFLEDPSKRLHLSDTVLAAFLWINDLALSMIIASVTIYSEPARQKRLFRVLTQLQQINIHLKNNPSTKAERIKIIAVTCILAFAITFQGLEIYTMIDDNQNWLILTMSCTFYFANILGLLATLQWGCTALILRSAATELNRQLQQLRYVNLKPEEFPSKLVDCFTETKYEAKETESEIAATPSQLQAKIRSLAHSYEQLGDVVKQMTATDGLIALTTLMATFFRLVATPYYVALRIYCKRGVVSIVVLPFCWTVLHLTILLVTVEPCHLTQKQRDITKFLLSQLMVHLAPKCKLLSGELNRFVTQIRLTDAKFMPLGVYVLTRPLIATMIGGVLTYLVLMLQFLSYNKHV